MTKRQKLSDYISEQIDAGKRLFDIGIWRDATGNMVVDDDSPNRVRFQVKVKEEMKR